MKPNLLVIDGSHTIFRAIFASMNNTNEKYNPKFTLFLFLKSMLKELTSYPSLPIICFDKGRSTYRNELMSGQYKANRDKEDKTIILDSKLGNYDFEDNNGKSINDLDVITLSEYYNILSDKLNSIQLPEVMEYLNTLYSGIKEILPYKTYIYGVDTFKHYLPKLGIPIIQVNGYEADDFAYYFSNYSGLKGRLVSDDKDWILALSPEFSLRRPISDKLVTYEDINNEYGDLLRPSVDGVVVSRMIKSITGDPGDNIPSFKGLGFTTARKLVSKLLNNPDSNKFNLLNLSESDASTIIGTRLKTEQTFCTNLNQIKLNYKLVGFDHIDTEKDFMKSKVEESINELSSDRSQLTYISLCSSIDSTTLISNFTNISRIPKIDSVNNIITK